MMNNELGYLKGTDVELADVQDVSGLLQKKIEYYKKKYPYAYAEINQMEEALYVISDLENDICYLD